MKKKQPHIILAYKEALLREREINKKLRGEVARFFDELAYTKSYFRRKLKENRKE